MNATSAASEGFLVSFCFASEGELEAELAQISAFADILEARFRYWEIVYVFGESQKPKVAGLASLLSKS